MLTQAYHVQQKDVKSVTHVDVLKTALPHYTNIRMIDFIAEINVNWVTQSYPFGHF